MTNQWNQGRELILAMLADNRLSQITPNRDQAEVLLTQARQHLSSATTLALSDPEGSYVLAYDAARKALTAVLEVQGLRTSSARGHHLNLFDAVVAQLDPPMGKDLRPFSRMRRRRNEVEYPSIEMPAMTATDVLEDVGKASVIVEVCSKVIDHLPAFAF
ncbi:MAG: hypothetical protein PHN51_01375 [Candidatus Nanopelagicales bacterium]|nr:hypothetical protein [Candidatus Nanopelagicales bacterium]